MACIICHLSIVRNSSQDCPNGHPAHSDCLKEWLLHSSNCPLCREPYSKEMLDKFKNFIKLREDEKLALLDNDLRIEELKKMEGIASKMSFLKFVESIDILINEQEYDYALSRLELNEDSNISNRNEHNTLFLKGKINYIRGRYDLAISQLFKLVKDKYNYPDGFLFLGKAYEALGLDDKAKWAYERVN